MYEQRWIFCGSHALRIAFILEMKIIFLGGGFGCKKQTSHKFSIAPFSLVVCKPRQPVIDSQRDAPHTFLIATEWIIGCNNKCVLLVYERVN